MKLYFQRTTLTGFVLLFLNFGLQAQYTETFESQQPNARAFMSNGQSFTLTNSFAIYSSRSAIGYNGSRRFIDNVGSVGLNQVNEIKTTNAALFMVQGFWLFLSEDGGSDPSQNGSVIITGKLNGATVFTVTKTLGFNHSYEANDGFTFVDLSTEGGINNAGLSINELSFQLQGGFNYIALDDFTWLAGTVLPVTVIDVSGILKGGQVLFDWTTSCESNSSHFIVERSSDGFRYAPVTSLKGAGFCNTVTSYHAIDQSPLAGTSYYRLIAVDFDGKRKQHGSFIIKNITNYRSAKIYPNPANGQSVTLQTDQTLMGATYIITDQSGRIVQHGIVSMPGKQINISRLSKGVYSLKLGDGQLLQWIKN